MAASPGPKVVGWPVQSKAEGVPEPEKEISDRVYEVRVTSPVLVTKKL